MLEVHRESGGFAPGNSFSACLLAKNDHIGRARLDLLNQGGVIPLGFTPWNACPVEFRSAGPLRGIKQGVHISLGPFSISLGRTATFALCSLRYALCPMLYALSLCPLRHALSVMHHACYSTGVRRFFEEVSHKVPLSHDEGGAFLLFLAREIKSIFRQGSDYFTGVSCGPKSKRAWAGNFSLFSVASVGQISND